MYSSVAPYRYAFRGPSWCAARRSARCSWSRRPIRPRRTSRRHRRRRRGPPARRRPDRRGGYACFDVHQAASSASDQPSSSSSSSCVRGRQDDRSRRASHRRRCPDGRASGKESWASRIHRCRHRRPTGLAIRRGRRRCEGRVCQHGLRNLFCERVSRNCPYRLYPQHMTLEETVSMHADKPPASTASAEWGDISTSLPPCGFRGRRSLAPGSRPGPSTRRSRISRQRRRSWLLSRRRPAPVGPLRRKAASCCSRAASTSCSPMSSANPSPSKSGAPCPGPVFPFQAAPGCPRPSRRWWRQSEWRRRCGS